MITVMAHNIVTRVSGIWPGPASRGSSRAKPDLAHAQTPRGREWGTGFPHWTPRWTLRTSGQSPSDLGQSRLVCVEVPENGVSLLLILLDEAPEEEPRN